MSRGRIRAGGAGLAGLLLVAAAPGQQRPDGFDRLYAAAQQVREPADADPAAVREAFAAALRAFLQIPIDDRARAARLAPAANAALEAGRPAMALELVGDAIDRDGPSAFRLGVQLRALVAVGDRERVLAVARSAAASWPAALEALAGDPRAVGELTRWGDGWLREGREDDGLWAFRTAASSGEPGSLANLALALRHAGFEADAEATYRQALAAAPGDAGIWNDLGLLLRAAGRAAEAVEVFRHGYGLEPEPGAGPATTNLLQMSLLRPDLMPEPPLPEAARALRRRPEAAMLRRVLLDRLLLPPFPPSGPDRTAGRR